MSEELWESTEASVPPEVTSWGDCRIALERSLPTLPECLGIDVFLADSQHWAGIYAIPNCPQIIDVPTAITAYRCAVRRYGGNAAKVSQTKALEVKLRPFLEAFHKNGGVSLYHWAFNSVCQLRSNSGFLYQRNSNTGVGVVFDPRKLTSWNLSKMFRQFPSTAVVCCKSVDAVLTYRRRQQAVLAEAARIILATNQVQTGIAHVQAALPKEELKQLATAWKATAQAVEASLQSRIIAGEDVWQGIFPGLEK